PPGFEISFSDDDGYLKTLKLISAGVNTEKIIYVRFVPDEEKSYYDSVINTAGNLKSTVRVRGSSK
ncbi:MAG: hypothetical protein JST15_13790, partial [Bacteroidetes bacterium]|nr:hypothetical protein [Bacteroidota bacterium]